MVSRKAQSQPGEAAFVNLDDDTSMDVWNLEEVANAITGDRYSYTLSGKLKEWHEDAAVETPKPVMRFRGTDYWKAENATLDAWRAVMKADREAAEAKAWTKGELVDKAIAFMSRVYAYSDTKIANRDAYHKVDALYDFIAGLDNYGIPDKEKQAKMRKVVDNFHKKSGLR